MRVWKLYDLNIAKKCNFSSSLKEMNAFFSAHQMTYRLPAFHMKMYGLILNRVEREPEKSSVDNVVASLASRDDKTREKICACYPHFSAYYEEGEGEWKNYTGELSEGVEPVWKEERDNRREIEEILLKYPRTFHFSLFDYSLHGVRFSDEAEGSCYFLRGWDDGNKYTNLTLALKAEPSDAWREEEKRILGLFEEYFFCKAVQRGVKIALDEEERLQRERVRRKAKIIAHEIDRQTKKGLCLKKYRETYVSDPTYIIGKSLKAHFKGFPKPEYENGHYTFEKRDRWNNIFRLEIDNPPLYRTVHSEWSYEGVGFLFKFSLPSYAPKTQEELDAYLSDVATCLGRAENLVPQLGALYPPYPEWIP